MAMINIRGEFETGKISFFWYFLKHSALEVKTTLKFFIKQASNLNSDSLILNVLRYPIMCDKSYQISRIKTYHCNIFLFFLIFSIVSISSYQCMTGNLFFILSYPFFSFGKSPSLSIETYNVSAVFPSRFSTSVITYVCDMYCDFIFRSILNKSPAVIPRCTQTLHLFLLVIQIKFSTLFFVLNTSVILKSSHMSSFSTNISRLFPFNIQNILASENRNDHRIFHIHRSIVSG